MAEIYLTPNDINASDTHLVLAFLNSVQTAEEIARRVEIPNELDIGIKLGQRLLDAREQLGGQFSSLHQLLNVPLIGPERFTEIVTQALNRTALEILSRQHKPQDLSQTLGLAAQIDLLKKSLHQFEQLHPNRYRIEILALDKTPYLGEVVPLRIRVWDRIARKPKANLPLTIETNWGSLRWAKGLQVKQGSVINVRTSVAGEVICKLYTPTVEPLTVAQQNDLSLALGKLTHEAQVPNAARESFLKLTELYQHPLNLDLRKAIDIHYKSRQERVSESINIPAAIYQWEYEHALVKVYAHPQDELEQHTVVASAAFTLEYRDWLSPWYQIYKESLVEGNELQTNLNHALHYSEDEKGVVGHMVSSLHSFIAKQTGLIGERVGQQAGKEVVTRMLSQNPEFLSDNTKASLYTILNQAPTTVTANSKGSVGIANEVALDVGRNVGVYEVVDDYGNITSQLDNLQSAFGGIDSRVGTLESATANINFDQLTSDIEAFNTNYQNFESNYSQFNENLASFNTNYDNFNASYASFNTNYANFNSNYGAWQNDYLDFQNSLANFNVAKEQLIQNVTVGVNNALKSIETNITGTTGTHVVINPIENVSVGRNINRPDRG